MDLVMSKVLVLIFLGLIKLVSGLSPLLVSKHVKDKQLKWVEKIMAGVMCLGGGVLLATVFIHMLPEVRENLGRVIGENGEMWFPFGELILCAGFFLIFLIEASVHRIFNIQTHSHGLPTGAEEGHGHGHANEHGHGHAHGHGFHNQEEVMMERLFMGHANQAYENGKGKDADDPDTIQHKFTIHGRGHQSETNPVNTTSYIIKNDDDDLPAKTFQNSNQTIDDELKEFTNEKSKQKLLLSKIRSFIIVLALSVHSIFEGMAIGLQNSVEDIWKLFAAVAIHECAILFCVGNEMVSNGLKKCEIISYMLTLGIVTPIGITIGIVLTSNEDSESDSQILIVGILQGVAGGTLLYITFFEVLERDKLESVGMSGLLGAFLIIFGFAFMAGLEATSSHLAGGGDNSTAEYSVNLFGLADNNNLRG